MWIYPAIAATIASFLMGWNVNGWRLNATISGMQADQSQLLADANAKAAQNLSAAQTLGNQLVVALESSKTKAQAGMSLTMKEIANAEKNHPNTITLDPEWVRLYNQSLGAATDGKN